MGKKCYSDYVSHMLRHYVRSGVGDTQIGIRNLESVDSVLANCSDHDRLVIRELFGSGDSLRDNVANAAAVRNVDQDVIWIIVGKVTYEIAKVRGLI